MARVPWMRGIPGHPYSQRVVRRAKYLLAMKKKFPRCKNLTYAAIAKQCGVLTKKTIRDWDYKIMTVDMEKQRMQRKGHKRLLTTQEEEIAAGFIVLRSINSLNTSSPIIRAFFSEEFGIGAKHTWLCDWAKRNDLSWRRPQRRTYRLPLRKKQEILMKFLREVQSLNKEPQQLAAIDKCYFQSQPIVNRQLCMIGRFVVMGNYQFNIQDFDLRPIFGNSSGTPKREGVARTYTDCLYVMLVADGSVGPFYYATKDKKFTEPIFGHENGIVEISEEGRGFGGKSFQKYLKELIKKKYLIAGDLVLLDNESTFKSRVSQKILTDYSIDFKHYPSGLGSITNPCDNSFNAALKHSFYNMMAVKNDTSTQAKMSMTEKSYWQISDKSVHNMFRHCGLIDKDPGKQARILLREGATPIYRKLKIHQRQIARFLQWAERTGFDTKQFEIKRLV